LSIKPIECHGGCLGCYQKQARECGNFPAFDLDKVLKTLNEQMALDKDNKWNSPTLHGGEPMLLPIESIEAILKTVHDKYGRSGIQTSFSEYKTCVGISIDGDTAETNAGRWNAPGFDCQEMTDKTLDILERLHLVGINTTVIIVLRFCNAGTPDLQTNLIRFALRLKNEFGVDSIRFNPVIAFDGRTDRDEALENDVIASAFKKLIIRVVADERLRWYPAIGFINLLDGKSAECVFGECDPWATESEMPILGDGSMSVCMKRDGLILRTEKSRARYEMLRQVSQQADGCRGCYWWPYCKGGCPGAGIDDDWRNRSRFCEAYKQIFSFISELPLYENKEGACKSANSNGHGDREHGDSNDPAWRKAHPEWGKK